MTQKANNNSFHEIQRLIDKTTNISLLIVSAVAVPLNVVIFFALEKGEYITPRLLPFVLTISIICLTFLRNKVDRLFKRWAFICIFFSAACFCLILGLIDMAGLWFLLVIMYVIMAFNQKYALRILILSLLLTFITGFLLIIKLWDIPLNYDFKNCETACILTRSLHYIIISSIVFYILSATTNNLKKYLTQLESKNLELQELYVALEEEMAENKKNEKKILEAIIKTEENERKRIASDLHDGIGPILSTMKLFFQAFKDATEVGQKEEIAVRFDTTLNDVINNVSDISHNLSPRILLKYGLVDAVDAFIQKLDGTKGPRINLCFDKIQRFESVLEISVYRIICELINNTLKHAQAKNITIEILVDAESLIVKYRDDGIGFDVKEKLRAHMGIGLQNMAGRIKSLEGNIELKSSKRNGMEANLIVPYIPVEDGQNNTDSNS